MTFGRRTPRNSDPAQSDPHERSPLASASAYPGVEEMPEGPQENVPGQAVGGEALIRSSAFNSIYTRVFSSTNTSAVLTLPRHRVREAVDQIASSVIAGERLPVTTAEQSIIVDEILNDMFGTGPLEPLLADDSVTDILVNGPDQIYDERAGRLELTPLKFRDDGHVTNVAQRIAAAVGRRVDESSPMVDARLPDGSRVNVVLPPVAIRGASISIRKFAKRNITLARMAEQGNLSGAMVDLLRIVAA